MSLVGNLADLGLGDIFQIVSLSRRSGTLQLDTPAESGEIVFVAGKVVATSRSQSPQSVGDVLLHAGVVSPLLYQEMLAEQRRGTTGLALYQKFNLDPEALDKALESLLTRTVYEMFEWEDGTFSFVLALDPPLWTGFSLTAARVILTRGLNPQYLAIEGARIRDERQRQDPLESFLARSRPARESSSQATAELSSALRSADLNLDIVAEEGAPPQAAALPAPADSREPSSGENIIPFPQARRQREATPDMPSTIVLAPVVPPPTRITSAPAPILTAPGAALPPRPAAMVPPVGFVIPPDSIFATSRASQAVMRERHLLVIDDDVMTARLIATELGGKFAATHTACRVGDALDLLTKLAGESLVVAIDLIVPRADGRGILGGIEILEKLREATTPVPIVVFSDYRNEEAESRAKALGIDAVIVKPKKLQVFADDSGRAPSEAMRGFLRALSDALDASKAPSPVPLDVSGAPSPPFTFSELDPAIDATVAGLVEGADRDLGTRRSDDHAALSSLRSMLSELIDPANRDTITLLVLRYASEVIERGGLFLATRRAFVGLGGFLVNEESEAFVAKVRRIQIPVEQDSVFAKVVQYRATMRGPLADTAANRAMLEGLGGGWHGNPTAAIPIISGDRVAAILFGDNPSGKPLGGTDGLEIFLQQAGLAMDRALLERRLEESKKKRDT